MNYRIIGQFIIIIASYCLGGCSSSKKFDYNILQLALKDTITVDTTFLIEASGNFYAREDIIYKGPVALVKPKAAISDKNYLLYKTSTINFLFGGGGVEYETLKAKYINGHKPDSVEFKMTDESKAKKIIIGKDFFLLERKVKLKCFLLGEKDNEFVINPSTYKPSKVKKIVYYGVYSVE